MRNVVKNDVVKKTEHKELKKFCCKTEASKFSKQNWYSWYYWFCKKKTDFDHKLTNFSKRINSNKTRNIEIKTKLGNLEKRI